MKQKIAIFLTCLSIFSTVHSQENLNLVPEKTESISDEKLLAKKMFTSVLTKIENGSLAGLILKKDGQLQVEWSMPESLREKCDEIDECKGLVYLSIHNVENKGEIFYRVHNNKNYATICNSLETYPSTFSMSDALKQSVLQRTLSLVQTCFKPKSKGD